METLTKYGGLTFNVGFIVVPRRETVCDDLFIIDQHAADEK